MSRLEKRSNTILFVMYCLLLILAPVLSTILHIGAFNNILTIFLVLIICCIGIFFRINRLYSFSITDILVFLFILYGSISLYINSSFGLRFWEWSAIILSFIFVRLISERENNNLLIVLAFSGLIQSIIALTQICGLTSSNHPYFEATGSFNNPGQLGGYLSISFIISIGLLKKSKRRLFIYLFSFISITIGLALILADSRASMIASLFGLFFLFHTNISQYIKKNKLLTITGLILVVTLFVILLYSYRPESANGRLLIWIVSLGMIADKPLLGHGVGSFNKEYMLYQAEYFKNNMDSPFISVADNVAFAYNEFLHIAIEFGLVGLFLVIIILSLILLSKSKNYDQTIFKAGLVVFIVFSMFSYPSSVFSLFLILPVLLAGASNEVKQRYFPLKYILVPALCCFIIAGIKELLFYQHIIRTQKSIKYREDYKPLISTEDHLEKLMSEPLFNAQYTYLTLYKYKIEVNEEIIHLINPSCDVYCDIGDTFYKKGDFNSAKYYYEIASYMIPSRITPNYSLWKLHLEMDNIEAAKEIAHKIILQELKVQNTSAIRIKQEVKRWFNE